jgi:hypothetical protein
MADRNNVGQAVADSTDQAPSNLAPLQTKKKLNLELAPAAYLLLQKLVEETGKSMVDILRTGLALYGIAHDATRRGQSIGIIEGDKVIKEILIP